MPHTHPSIAAIGDGIADLIGQHIDHAFRVILRGPAIHIEPRFSRLLTREQHPFGNFALIADPADAPGTAAAIEPLVTCNVPAAALFTRGVSGPVADQLTHAGFELAESMPAMAVDIANLAPTTLPPGYRLEHFGHGSQAPLWADAFSRGYELPAPVGACFSPDPSAPPQSIDAPLQFFAILKGDRPVCTSALFLKEGVAGIYAVATLPEERGKGLGAHITAEPLRMVHALGYRVGVLQASAAGHPVYRRLGFQDFGGLPLYVRMPS